MNEFIFSKFTRKEFHYKHFSIFLRLKVNRLMNLKFRNTRSSPPGYHVRKCSKITPQFYRRTPMPKCEFSTDALQHLCRTTSGTTTFKEQCLLNASIFCPNFAKNKYRELLVLVAICNNKFLKILQDCQAKGS